jgi:hypothetical protein
MLYVYKNSIMAKRGLSFSGNEEHALTFARAAGKKTEDIIKSDLQILKAENKILSFLKTKSDDDIAGIDFFIFDLQNTKIPLQVKTRVSHQKTHVQKHPDIPSISVTYKYPKQRKEQLMQIVEAYPKGNCLHLTINMKKPLTPTKTTNTGKTHG